MHGVTRYILRQLLPPLLLIMMTLSGVVWLTQSLRFIDKIVANGLSVLAFVQFTSLLAPRILALVLPIAVFLSVLYTYHRLRSDSELVVLSAAGLSKVALVRPAIILAILAAFAGYLLSMFVAPWAHQAFKLRQDQLRSDLAAVMLQEGTFNIISDGLTVYIRERKSGGEMAGILVHDNRNPARPVTMMAESGALVNSPEGPRFIMVKGNRQQVDKAKGNLSLLYFDNYTLDLSDFVNTADDRWQTPGERFMNELFWPSDINLSAETRQQLLLEGHSRIVNPIYTIILALIALCPILAGEFSRRGMGLRILMAAGAALLVEANGIGLAMWARQSSVFIPVIYLYVAGCLAAAIYVLALRPRRRLIRPSKTAEMGG